MWCFKRFLILKFSSYEEAHNVSKLLDVFNVYNEYSLDDNFIKIYAKDIEEVKILLDEIDYHILEI